VTAAPFPDSSGANSPGTGSAGAGSAGIDSTGAGSTPGRPAAAAWQVRRLYLPTVIIAGLAGWLGWLGAGQLADLGLARQINAGRFELAGPAVLAFVLVMFGIEQLRPAERRPLLARGHLVDMCYLLAYALVVVPVIVLIGAGFAHVLAQHAQWLVIPRMPGVPGWPFIVAAVLVIDFLDWLAHLGNHRVTSLWRLHAVHHSQEELSILTTFRAHPLVHVSFLITAVPVLAISSNATTPAVVFTVYACLGALPHANVPWTYGPVGRVLISPAYHRIHHHATGRIDINLGTAFAMWDMMTRRAVFPVSGAATAPTGLSGRPVPVEQAAAGAPGMARAFLTQWAEPFAAIRKAQSP
jgi:sterol desaturase/sphingolipid hydroxylase (fatty acid hydroxylase superfamily)